MTSPHSSRLNAAGPVKASKTLSTDCSAAPSSEAHMKRRCQATARIVDAGDAHHTIAAELISTPGLSADDVPDVQLAALAIEHGLTLCTDDHGFARFGRLRWVDPLA